MHKHDRLESALLPLQNLTKLAPHEDGEDGFETKKPRVETAVVPLSSPPLETNDENSFRVQPHEIDEMRPRLPVSRGSMFGRF